MKNNLTRRDLLKYGFYSGSCIALPSFLSSCAVNPVTGEQQLMMVSQQREIEIDKLQSPHQFSSDYGISQDKALNRYIDRVGKKLLPHVHRPDMPYSFFLVNAVYINAYAFPGGTIAATRGIMLKLDNEAELGALLGHELGHVNARHSAEQMSKGTISSMIIGGLAIAAGSQSSAAGKIAQQIGMIGQNMLLSHYSRDNEREADRLGNEYMVNAGYSSKGFVGLMHMLNSMNKNKPSSAQILFSTHPMSSERYETAVSKNKTQYNASHNLPLNRDEYMDNTASLRMKKDAIDLMQEAEAFMMKKEYATAEQSLKNALNKAETDYTAHALMAKCLILQKNSENALKFALNAQKLYPDEAQAYHLSGFAYLDQKKFSNALNQFETYDRLLSGNPQITFFKGYSLEKMDQVQKAAEDYAKYLNMVQQGKYAKHAYTRLVEWGYIKKK